MIDIIDKSECCGCNACVQRCPKQCITIHEDEEGFLYPMVNRSVCINCGLCDKVCPVINKYNPRHPLEVFAAKNKNEGQRLRSSSGGIFILLAEYVIKKGGVVFGARFDKDWEVEHCYAETIEEVGPLLRSKYVQSRIGNTYNEAGEFLKQGRLVLFVGTSCQISGLKNFLRKDYDNLLAVDFICHGVPSPKVWRRYLEEIKSERSEAAGKNSVSAFSLKSVPVITGINFREKQQGGYSWKKYGFVVNAKSPDKGDKNTVLSSSIFGNNTFMIGFLSNLYLRPSCYKCPAKAGSSRSDITIGDFWGINNFKPDFDDDKGIGAVLAYTSKGKNVLKSINMDFIQMSYKEVIHTNPSIYSSVQIPKGRKKFWKHFFKNHTIKYSVSNAIKVTFMKRIQHRIILLIKSLLRK